MIPKVDLFMIISTLQVRYRIFSGPITVYNTVPYGTVLYRSDILTDRVVLVRINAYK